MEWAATSVNSSAADTARARASQRAAMRVERGERVIGVSSRDGDAGPIPASVAYPKSRPGTAVFQIASGVQAGLS